MHFYDAELVNRGRQILTPLADRTRARRNANLKARIASTKRAKAMLKRMDKEKQDELRRRTRST